MDIAFSSWGGYLVLPPYRRLASSQSVDASPPYKDLIEPGSESLRRHTALFHDFAELEATSEGVRAFMEKHADRGAEPQALFVPRSGGAVFVFPYDYKGAGPDDAAVLEVLTMKR